MGRKTDILNYVKHKGEASTDEIASMVMSKDPSRTEKQSKQEVYLLANTGYLSRTQIGYAIADRGMEYLETGTTKPKIAKPKTAKPKAKPKAIAKPAQTQQQVFDFQVSKRQMDALEAMRDAIEEQHEILQAFYQIRDTCNKYIEIMEAKDGN